VFFWRSFLEKIAGYLTRLDWYF